MSWCRKCGTELKEGIKFCAKCGTPVSGSKHNANSYEMPSTLKDNNPSDNTNIISNSTTQQTSSDKRQNNKLIVGLVAALTLGALSGGYFYLNSKDIPATSVNTQIPATEQKNVEKNNENIENKKVENKQMDDATKQNSKQNNINDAKNALEKHYQALNSRDFRGAYAGMTENMQNQMGVYNNFVDGYKDTVSSDISNIKVEAYYNDRRIVFVYTLKGSDAVNGRKSSRNFNCKVDMVKQENRWLIDNREASVM